MITNIIHKLNVASYNNLTVTNIVGSNYVIISLTKY